MSHVVVTGDGGCQLVEVGQEAAGPEVAEALGVEAAVSADLEVEAEVAVAPAEAGRYRFPKSGDLHWMKDAPHRCLQRLRHIKDR